MVRMQRYRNLIQTVNLLIVSNDKGAYVITVTGIVRLVACPVLSALFEAHKSYGNRKACPQ
jgi:hypothetical protein